MKRQDSPSTASPLLTTNLSIPQLHGELVSRSELVRKLDLALSFPLTVISAPAGFGKTTLLAQWCAGNEGLRERTAWLSLDKDFDVVQFWKYVTAALRPLQSGIGQSAVALLRASEAPGNTALSALINEIATSDRELLLILDDYERVDDPAVHSTLMFFIDHLPPKMHVMIASRSHPALPLARWRASSRLYELREADLRFTSEEISIFLNQLRRLDLSEDELAAIATRTEGWIAGLQLVALSLEGADHESRRQFVFAFKGSQRYILDYLVEEVLNLQPEDVRSFLLQTSVLERLSAPLCDWVTGRKDAPVLLDQLERAHLFIIPLDREQRWYRYHYLFLDVLRHRLRQKHPEEIPELHRRAAEWYREAGHVEDAVRHACAAHEWDLAVELIEQIVAASWNRGEIRKIVSWLGQVPAAQLDAHPRLSLYYSRALLLGGKMDAADRRLRDSEKLLRSRFEKDPSAEDGRMLGSICAFRTTVAAVSGEAETASALGQEALSLLPLEDIDVRAHVTNSLGVNSYYVGDMAETIRACTEAAQRAEAAGNLYLAMVATMYRAAALASQGQLRQAGSVLAEALTLVRAPSWSGDSWIPAASVIWSNLGGLLYEWDRLEEAERYLTQAIELGQSLAYGSSLWSSYDVMVRIRLARGDREGARTMSEEAQRYRSSHTVPMPARLLDVRQAAADLSLGQVASAERWAAVVSASPPSALEFIREFEDIIRAGLHLKQDRPDLALGLLNRARPAAEASGRQASVLRILLLTALAQRSLGDDLQARSNVIAALGMAEAEGYVRTFVDLGQPLHALLRQVLEQGLFRDYCMKLLSISQTEEVLSEGPPQRKPSSPTRSADDQLIEPLSQRELEVLRLMANGASNEEIARDLVIAPTTAKKHVSNILHKFGVTNRTQAIVRGRSLHLC